MNRADFLKIMEKSASIDPGKTAEIGEIVSLFPYFHTAHLLLLKGLHTNSDISFGNQLKNSAIQVADREKLFNFLHSNAQDKQLLPDLTEMIAEHEEAAGHQEKIIEPEKKSDAEVSNGNQDLPEIIPENGSLLELDLEKQDDDPGQDENITGGGSEPHSLSQADLIDRFIISNPRIEPNREKKEIPVEDRSAPVFEEGGFVTETLARIYIDQGYYSKAIDIFEKLSLKYPEKSSYFATQIEKVKEFLKK